MNRTPKQLWGSLAAVLLLLVSGCASATAADTGAETVDDDTLESTAVVEESAVEESSDAEGDEVETSEKSEPLEDYTSPIQDFLGVDYSNFDDEDAQARFVEEQRVGEEKIATCMRELGWEYTPRVEDLDFGFGGDLFGEDGLEYGSDEWVAKWGLGITTQSFPQSDVGPDLLGYDDSAYEQFVEDGPTNPNAVYTEGLSESESAAYFQDLYGEAPEFDETLTEEEQDDFWESYVPTGCQAVAWEDQLGGGAEVQEFYETFNDEIDGLYERVSADPRIVAEQTKITDCLAKAGHQLAADEDLFQQFFELFEKDLESLDSNSNIADAFEGLDPGSMTEEEVNEILDGVGPRFTAEQLTTLADLQKRELDLAADVLACKPDFISSGGQDEIFFEVLAEYEQKFLDENAAALAEFDGVGAE